jgi:hypothetical protein
MTLRRTVPTGKPGLAIAGLAMAGLTMGAAIAGCSSSPSSGSGTQTTPVTASVPAKSSPPPSFASAGSASSAAVNSGNAAGGPPGCATSALKARTGVAQGAAGSVYQTLIFTNVGSSACSLYGYPGVALAGGSPVTQIGAPATRSTASGPSLVTLAAGDSANTTLRITVAQNYPSSKCAPKASTYLQIYPPNQTAPMYLAYKSTGCSSTAVKLLMVSVMQSGTGS